MSASSLSIAAISPSSPASSAAAASSSDHFTVGNLHFPCKIALPLKFSSFRPHNLHKLPLFSRVSRPVRFCASSGLDSVEATQSSGKLLEEENVAAKEEKEDEVTERVASQSTEARRLYVGNLPFSMTSSQLTEIFSEAGCVVSVEVVFDKVTDRSRGFAFATMGSVEEAKEAIRLFDGSLVGGRTVKVNFPEVPRGGEREVTGRAIKSSYQTFVDTPHKIYAGNLSWGLTSQGLKDTFQKQPGLLSARVMYDRDTGRSRGFGFVTFSSAEEVAAALDALNGVEVEGRPLRLNMAEQRPLVSPSPSPSPSPSELETEEPETITDSNELFSGVSS